jgi:hypothetical protein
LQEDEDDPTICFKKLHDFEYRALREREREREREEEIDVREIERRGRRITEYWRRTSRES